MSSRVGVHSPCESQCCGTSKFKQINHLPHLLELSEGFSLSSVQSGGKEFSEEEAATGAAQPLVCPHHSSFDSVSFSTHLISLVRTQVSAGLLTGELKQTCSKYLFVGVFSSLLVPPAVRGVGESGSLS